MTDQQQTEKPSAFDRFMRSGWWICDYANSRRQHRHRCRVCCRIIDIDERVVMMRQRRGTWALHIECAARPHSPTMTYGEVFAFWWAEPRGSDPHKAVEWARAEMTKERESSHV